MGLFSAIVADARRQAKPPVSTAPLRSQAPAEASERNPDNGMQHSRFIAVPNRPPSAAEPVFPVPLRRNTAIAGKVYGLPKQEDPMLERRDGQESVAAQSDAQELSTLGSERHRAGGGGPFLVSAESQPKQITERPAAASERAELPDTPSIPRRVDAVLGDLDLPQEKVSEKIPRGKSSSDGLPAPEAAAENGVGNAPMASSPQYPESMPAMFSPQSASLPSPGAVPASQGRSSVLGREGGEREHLEKSVVGETLGSLQKEIPINAASTEAPAPVERFTEHADKTIPARQGESRHQTAMPRSESPAPGIVIGRIEVIVESPVLPAASAPATALPADFASRHYLRGL